MEVAEEGLDRLWCCTLQHSLTAAPNPLQDFVSGAIPGMVKDVSSPPSGSPSWANQTINGFYFTPASAALPVFGTPGNYGMLQLYVIDTGRRAGHTYHPAR